MALPAAIRCATLVAALAVCSLGAQPVAGETIKAPVKLTKGECGQISPLEGMMRTNDGVEQFTPINCVFATFTPPPDSKSKSDGKDRGSGLVALLDASGEKGLFARGSWKNSDFNPTEISFDQQTWYSVSKGRCRFYIKEAEQSLLIVCFAVYKRADSKSTQGVAVVFKQE